MVCLLEAWGSERAWNVDARGRVRVWRWLMRMKRTAVIFRRAVLVSSKSGWLVNRFFGRWIRVCLNEIPGIQIRQRKYLTYRLRGSCFGRRRDLSAGLKALNLSLDSGSATREDDGDTSSVGSTANASALEA